MIPTHLSTYKRVNGNEGRVKKFKSVSIVWWWEQKRREREKSSQHARHAPQHPFHRSHAVPLSLLTLSWKRFSFQLIVRKIRHLNFYSCDKRDSILFPWIVPFFAASHSSEAFFIVNFLLLITFLWYREEINFSSAAILVSFYRCASFVIHANELYMSVGMLRIILFLLSCNNELLFCLNTAYGKDFMAILTICKMRNVFYVFFERFFFQQPSLTTCSTDHTLVITFGILRLWRARRSRWNVQWGTAEIEQ